MNLYTSFEIQYNISNIKDINNKRSYLVLTNIETTPPHCSLLCTNSWYSLNYQECKTGVPVEYLYKVLCSKNTSAIFLELKHSLDVQKVKAIYAQYKQVDFEKKITCISPIKEILRVHQIPVSKNAFLFNMIEELLRIQEIIFVSALHYPCKEYRLKHYSLNELSEVKA